MRVRLDGQDFNFKFRYASRQERFYLSIYSADETPLALGIKLVCNIELVRYYRNKPGMFPGELAVVATVSDTTPPTLLELGPGKRCELTYFTLEELEAEGLT
jgi:hypothetical protein